MRLAPRRIPRGFGLNMAGKPSPFGIDAEELDDSREKLDQLPAMLDGAGVIKPYGQSETFRSAALLPSEFARKRQSVGRRDEMLKVAGNRVYPLEIGNQLAAIQGVAEAEVVGVKRHDDETRLVAFVVQETGRTWQPTMLRRALASRLPALMLPEHVLILPALPRTAHGKPDRQTLAARAADLILQRER